MQLRACGEGLFDQGGLAAVCRQPYGTEHSHSDETVTELVAAGLASPVEDGMHYVTIELENGEIETIRFLVTVK